jgi:hypothetical protein
MARKNNQLGLFSRQPRNGASVKLGVGSCVWALVQPSLTRTPNDPHFVTAKSWRRARVFAYGRPFAHLYVKLDRPLGGRDAEIALRVSTAKTKPKTKTAGMDAAEFKRRAGPMGKYQLGTCERK